ncbi:TPA: hypothetical protein DIV55_04230 [Patescibacteria group bacterium]|uniref:Arsenite methyltransferase n=1 Tax=Candidatus Gottesmanbacteria bacterium GW2011_GWA1_43_11 TaxID=1618436 RepID=A0A0G1FCG2_9BACT|nr:MAG: Methyltransferase type 11 [Candidatus Gottesmanbacteria bacterium GW2011_GWA1_43_11]HCS78921.1 hypothetical protein [Patescibacteria group bacterium]
MVVIAQMQDKRELKAKIKEAVCHMYEEVSLNPSYQFHFPVGKNAAREVGYPSEMLSKIPIRALESFAGVGYHFQNNTIKEGDSVLDIGSGSGTDLLIAAQLVGSKGKVVGVDITDAMIEKSQKAIKESGTSNVSVVKVDGEKLPFAKNTFDVVISNGVINLIPDKKRAFKEIFRVLKSGGVLSIADIVLGEPISEESRQNPTLWAECVVGASLESLYVDMIQKAGFSGVEIIDTLDYFAKSLSRNTRDVAKEYQAHSVILKAVKSHSVKTSKGEGGDINDK